MKPQPLFTKTLLSIFISTMGIPMLVHGAALPLVQYPAGTASKEPAPNVIISVDNSGSMGSTGINNLKKALKETFNTTNTPDNSIRLAYQSMWGCNTIPSKLDKNYCKSGMVGKNTMKSLQGAHRTDFLTWVDTLKDLYTTPSHEMAWNAGEYLRLSGSNTNPWYDKPGEGPASQKALACRRAYHILMTDGGWNSTEDYKYQSNNEYIGNADGRTWKLPDGKTYDPSSAETKIYKDSHGSDYLPTLSDVSFYYWATDLQKGIANEVVPLIKKSGNENFQAGNQSQILSEYWNPKNNPATWQNMTTYTIGYNDAASWPENRQKNNPIFKVSEKMYGGDFSAAVVGTKFWSDVISGGETERQEELWHMAINGRGKFYPAKTPQDLIDAFKDIVGGIIQDSTKPATSFNASAASVAGEGADLFVAGYDAAGWEGYIQSTRMGVNLTTFVPNPDWGVTGALPPKGKSTAHKLDELNALAITNRLILSKKDDSAGTAISFNWSNLTDSQKTQLNTLDFKVDALGESRVDFIRGVRDKEGNTTAKPFRERASRQGDIVNSSVWYVKTPVANYRFSNYPEFSSLHKDRLPMLYVGGNDGMLHGFSAVDGTEKIAYIPEGLIKKLPELTKRDYVHKYYVDGSPFTGDVNIGTGTDGWRTMLVASLGAGGKGYFVLDVTTPGNTVSGVNSPASNFSANKAAELVVMDKTNGNDDDVGHIFGNPIVAEFNPQQSLQITRMNDQRWALITGNGYNSKNERPVLLIQYLDGAKELKKITAASTGSNAVENGLSTPLPVDLNADGMVDMVYAGDLQGNFWKFDLSSSSPSKWGVAFSGSAGTACTNNCTPLMVAKDASDTRQAITSAPNFRRNKSVGGLMLAFGTGRNITEGDRTDRGSVQTFYSILDDTQYETILTPGDADKGKLKVKEGTTPSTVPGRSALYRHSFDAVSKPGEGQSIGETFWHMPKPPVPQTVPPTVMRPDYASTTNAKKGWYLDLPAAGERVLSMPTFYDGSNVLRILSEIPASGGNISEETCGPIVLEVKYYETLMGIEFGQAPTIQLLDANGDGLFNADDENTNRHTTKPGMFIRVKNGIKKVNERGGFQLAPNIPKPPLTINWRQLQ